MEQTIRVYGEREDILPLKSELEARFAEENITISSPKPYVAQMGSRQAYRHIEWYEVLIGIGVNLLSSVVYDEIKKNFLIIKIVGRLRSIMRTM